MTASHTPPRGPQRVTSRAYDPTCGIAYVRVSTEEQQLGPDAQRAAIARWAEGAGVSLLETHEDRISGRTNIDERPGLLAALAAMRRHRAGLLVVAKRDRIARNVLITLQLEHLLTTIGRSRIASADGVTSDDGPEAALFRLLIDAFAAYERAMIRVRTQGALAVRRSRGQRFCGHAPLGYDHVPTTPDPDGRPRWLLGQNEHEAGALARAQELRAGGLSQAAIARILTEEGHPARGRRWHQTSVARMLRRDGAGKRPG